MKSLTEKLGITPGPWEWNDRSTCVILPDGKAFLACVHASVTKDNIEEDIATARFIAAAPEMLEALIECTCDMIDRYGDDYENHNRLNPGIKSWMKENISIIEKATGKTWGKVKEIVENE